MGSDMHFYQGITGKFNATTYQVFLQGVLDQTTAPLFLVQDGAKYHHAAALQPFWHAHRGRFEKRIAALDEVVECWEVSGALDYVARFVCPDLASYEELTSALIDDDALGVARIVSHVALRAVRRFAGYPESLLAPKVTPG